MTKMKRILWVQFAPFGVAGEILGMKGNGVSGGWISTEYENLDKNEFSVAFLCCSAAIKSIIHKKTEKGEAWCIPAPKITYGKDYSPKYEDVINSIIEEARPDIIHIWGTETFLPAVVAALTPDIPKVLYVQGLLGMHERYVGGYINGVDKKYYRHSNILQRFLSKIRDYYFRKQVDLEKRIIKQTGNIITDNQFTRAYCNSVSEKCSFYSHALMPSAAFKKAEEWNFAKVERHSIFALYSLYPEKGLHQLLKAILIVKKAIPDVKVYIPGPYHIINHKIDGKKLLPYEMWLKTYIDNNDLADNIVFIGSQNADGMIEHFQKAHVFINTSCMEVHSSTLREAMIVGTPSISTLCGSVGEFLTHGRNGLLYRYEEPEVLAWEIISLFSDDDLAKKMSKNARLTMSTFEEQVNSIPLGDIYTTIIKEV